MFKECVVCDLCGKVVTRVDNDGLRECLTLDLNSDDYKHVCYSCATLVTVVTMTSDLRESAEKAVFLARPR